MKLIYTTNKASWNNNGFLEVVYVAIILLYNN